MSLLLDALKKAADDKQKASQSSTSEEDKAEAAEDVIASTPDETLEEELSLDAIEEPAHEEAVYDEVDVEDTAPELTLDEIETAPESNSEEVEPVVAAVDADATAPLETSAKSNDESLSLDKNFKADASASQDPETSTYTVSDDALSMLIYKTNRDVKHGRKIFFISILLASMAVLVTGGVYYYLDMQTEIAALERKHQLSMRAMQSKTSSENTPAKSEIIRNLVGDSDLDDKVQYAKSYVADGKNNTAVRRVAGEGTTNNSTAKRADGSTLSIQKTAKADPVGEKLDEAWLAYEAARYGEAQSAYKNVLSLEKGNRDALLGLGAIAVMQNEKNLAREYYMQLLELDPRDSMATAGLTSLHDSEASLQKNEAYLLSLLQKNPEAQHLNFALGNNYAQQQKWSSAQQYYFNAWQRDSNNADYLFNLAVSMDQLGKPEQALTFYRNSLTKAQNKKVSFSREAVGRRIKELSGT